MYFRITLANGPSTMKSSNGWMELKPSIELILESNADSAFISIYAVLVLLAGDLNSHQIVHKDSSSLIGDEASWD